MNMPISGQGWEIHIVRSHSQRRKRDGKERTVGAYQVYRDGVAVAELAGTTAESAGPGSNLVMGNGRRVEPGRYPLATQAGATYVTHNYHPGLNHAAVPRPGILLENTGNRVGILIHPGRNFLAAVGCINLCKVLPGPEEPISFAGSRARVIAVIDDLARYLGADFPRANGLAIPRAFAVIEGEPR